MSVTIEKLLNSYPRQHPPLSDENRRLYEREYKGNRTGNNLFYALSQWCEGWMHRTIAERAVGRYSSDYKLLEIGAGTLNHVPYERGENRPAVFDVIEPLDFMVQDSPHIKQISKLYRDLHEVPAENRYQRIISIAVLEHLEELPYLVAKSALLLTPDGLYQHGIPSEGALLWGTSWRLTTGLSYWLRTGQRYGNLMRHEHVNEAPEIVAVVRYFFDTVELSRFPLPLFHGSVYTYLQASSVKRDRCSDFIKNWEARSKSR